MGIIRKVRKSSSRADHSFQALKLHFWFSVYIGGVEIVGGACIADFLEDFHCGLQTDLPARMSVNSSDGTSMKFWGDCHKLSRGLTADQSADRSQVH